MHGAGVNGRKRIQFFFLSVSRIIAGKKSECCSHTCTIVYHCSSQPHFPCFPVSQKTQALADQAWEKVRMTNTVHTGLESECDQLQDHLTHSQSERDVLLTACSLLAGAFYPLYARTNVLSCERNILDQHAINCDSFKKQAAELVTTLGMELGDSLVGQQYGKRSPLLRFRAAVIAVLAANRLNYFQHYCSRMFLTYSTSIGINPTLVSTGGMTSSKKPFKGNE